jgi:hypothetical protein
MNVTLMRNLLMRGHERLPGLVTCGDRIKQQKKSFQSDFLKNRSFYILDLFKNSHDVVVDSTDRDCFKLDLIDSSSSPADKESLFRCLTVSTCALDIIEFNSCL